MKTRILGLLGTALLARPIIGLSTPITYDFLLDAGSSGPLAGTSASGYFSFDSSIIPAAGGLLNQAGLLTDLAFAWNGVSYDETTANTGSLTFDSSGALTGALFGSACKPGGCDISSRMVGWDVNWNPSLHSQYFTYSFGNGQLGFGTATITAAPATSVPEPRPIGLLGLGLGALWLSRRCHAGSGAASAVAPRILCLAGRLLDT
jgi:hypothetical protein